jgi:predicted O-methyltransferase YrrM
MGWGKFEAAGRWDYWVPDPTSRESKVEGIAGERPMDLLSQVKRKLRHSYQRWENRISGREYPAAVAVDSANHTTVGQVKASGARVYAELGVYLGHTAELVAPILSERHGTMHLFDFEERTAPLKKRLDAMRLPNLEVRAYGNSHKTFDSYCWALMKLLRESKEPIFDYVFIDGAHTWDVDGFAFVLADRLLKPGGIMDFDDAGWTLEGSPALNPRVFPRTSRRYTTEQIVTPQVGLILDLLVRRDPRYEEIVPDKVFRRRDGSA